MNFPRIDVYSAILSIDETSPNVILASPSDNASKSPQNFTFRCNATDELQLNNLTFSLWNSTGLYYENTTQALGNSLEVEFNLSLTEDDYSWNCLSSDKKSNSAFASANFSLTVKEKFVTLSSPGDNSYTNVNSTNFTCNSQTDSTLQLVNSTFSLWNSTDNLLYSETKNILGNSNETTFNFILTDETPHLWNCLFYDNSSKSLFSNSNFTLTYDATDPNITLVSPADGDSSLTGTNNVDFKYNVSEKNLSNCSLIVDDVEEQTSNSVNVSITNEFTKSLSEGVYAWKISCGDLVGNVKNSSVRTLIINSPPSNPSSSSSGSSSGSSGGSGGGSSGGSSTGSSSSTYNINQEQVERGISKSLKANDKIKFNVKNEEHSLKISTIFSNEVILIISSDPITLILKIGETRKVNLDNDEYYDLEVSLNSIKSSKADVSIKSINEKIPVKNVFNQDDEINELPIELENIDERSGFITGFAIGDFTLNKQRSIGIVVSVFVILFIYFVIRIKRYFSKVNKREVKKKKL